MTEINIKITGLNRLMKGFKKFPLEIARGFSLAGHTAGTEILAQPGLGTNYPPLSTQRRPPQYPYYQRGRGTVYSSGGSDNSSENMGKKWYIRRTAAQVEIGNVASYAYRVHGEQQTALMKKFGWKKLEETAKKMQGRIELIYQTQVDKLIARLGL